MHQSNKYTSAKYYSSATNNRTMSITAAVTPEVKGGRWEAREGEEWAKAIDLKVLWQMLERHQVQMEEKVVDHHTKGRQGTWELLVLQGILLTALVLIALSWAFCCKKRCWKPSQNSPTVAEALRKLSKDLPPSYSNTDLHSLAISVHDHLNPPPLYRDVFRDDLQYLDLEAGHSRMAKLSFSAPGSAEPRISRISVASCATCSSEAPVVVPITRPTSRTSSQTPTESTSSSSVSSRKSSRNSRVSFSEEVECSNGSIRRLSSNQSSSSSSRKSSASSEGSRKSSLISRVQRKLGTNPETFDSQLDDELKEKLAKIGDMEGGKVVNRVIQEEK